MCLRALIFKLLDARARLAPRPGAERPLAATAGAERGTPAPEPRVTPSAAPPAGLAPLMPRGFQAMHA